MFDFSLSRMADSTTQNLLGVFIPQQRIFVLYLLTSLAMAWLVWRAEMRREGKGGKKIKDFFTYVFNPGIYNHKSSWQDYFIFFANGILHYGLIAQFILSERYIAVAVRKSLLSTLGPLDHPLIAGFAGIALFTLAIALLYDFAIYYAHLLTHKRPMLWAFHKVHHSAEVLTPVTLLRMHPVDLFLNGLLVAVFVGAGIGIFSYLSLREMTDLHILGINAVLFAFYFAGYNLRHSHVWLHYPAWLSHFLVSPAQHQIHHSVEPRHMNKNLGLIFSFWDKIFGTLYTPKDRETLVFGIDKEERNPYSSVKEMYWRPFVECRDLLRDKFKKKKMRAIRDMTATAAGFIGLVLLYFQMTSLASGGLMDPPSPHLEELTWTEVYQAQRNGYNAVIIPAGGTEQNGPHMILGKHNHIVRHTAGEIARRLGNTLVAPVIAYVPEGEIDPRLTENMQWSGTIGVPPQVLEDVLYWAAMGLKQHGFKYIYFIGDHGFDQAPQQHAADKLAALWKKENIVVKNISSYYGDGNGQVAWLKQKGFSEKEIGIHAGIRDTAELMYVHPSGIRADPVTVRDLPDGIQGDPGLATKEIGQKMIELKISAAVEEIRRVRKENKN